MSYIEQYDCLNIKTGRKVVLRVYKQPLVRTPHSEYSIYRVTPKGEKLVGAQLSYPNKSDAQFLYSNKGQFLERHDRAVAKGERAKRS